VVWMLLKYECLEIFPIHPQAAGQFRQALYYAETKSTFHPARSRGRKLGKAN